LLKLHGDSDNPSTYILRDSEYRTAYADPFDFHLPLPKALRQIFVSRSMLFLGCSLNGDWTLELLRFIKEQNEYELPNHWAILSFPPDPVAKAKQETSLLEAGIQPIWYPADQHEFLDQYLSLALNIAENVLSLGSLELRA
jgi:hypothetical protein